MNYSNYGIRKKRKELNSNTKKLFTKILVYVFKAFITIIMVISVLGTSLGIGSLTGVLETSPEITLTDVTPSQYKTTIYDCNNIAIETLVASGANRIYVTYDEIPTDLVNAFIAIEDERFWGHNGVDAKGIIRAAYMGVSSGFKFTEGASTITQQLIKNSVFSDYLSENSLSDRLRRKIQEQYLALKLEQTADKEQIMENYLNTINLGNNNLGVQSAARNYFNKDVSELTLSECAVIAAITQNPSKYNPARFPDENETRREKVLKNMLEQDMITKEAYNAALEDPVYERILNNSANATSSAYSYYTDALITELMEDLMTEKGYTYTQAYNVVYRGGLSIYSCEDSTMQKYAQDMINNADSWNGYLKYSVTLRFQVRDPEGNISKYTETSMLVYYQKQYGESYHLVYETKDDALAAVKAYEDHILKETEGVIIDNSESITYTEQPQCSYVAIENGTGYVRVLIGGRGPKEQSRVLNRATGASRMAGSTVKPLMVYAPAIDTAGYGTGTVIDDIPYFWNTGAQVHNYDEVYLGYTTARYALADSRNIPAVKVLEDVGIMTGVSYMKRLGITTLTPNDYYLPTAIGTCNVTNYELTTAYSVIANDGNYIEPKLYTKVLDHDGNVILDNTTTAQTRVLKESTTWMLTEMMHSVASEGTINWAFSDKEPLYIACKTGTSQDYVDKWLVGFAGNYTTGIWAGFDSDESYDIETYGSAHITIWKDLIYYLNGGSDAKSSEKPKPDSVVAVKVCKDSGLLAVEGLCDCDERGSRVSTEYFAAGTEPREKCKTHVEVTICTKSKELACDECPDKYKKTTVRVLKEFGNYDPNDADTKVMDAKYSVTEEELNNPHCSTHCEEGAKIKEKQEKAWAKAKKEREEAEAERKAAEAAKKQNNN